MRGANNKEKVIMIVKENISFINKIWQEPHVQDESTTLDPSAVHQQDALRERKRKEKNLRVLFQDDPLPPFFYSL